MSRRSLICFEIVFEETMAVSIDPNSCPLNAIKSTVDLGLRPVKTSSGVKLHSVVHSVVLSEYCTKGTISGQRLKFHVGPDSPRMVLKTLKHSLLCLSIPPFAHGE